MNKGISVNAMPRLWRAGVAMLAASVLLMMTAIGVARAQTWFLHDVLEPPVLPDVDPADPMGFGSAVSVGSVPWLVVGAPLADCPNPGAPGTIVDTGRIFIYRRVAGVWQFHQSFCAASPQQYARYGSSLDMSQSWMIVGAPGAAADMSGRVEMFRLDPATQQWTRQLVTTGVTNGHLGASVSIDRGLAVAGEPGYNMQRGRLRSWKLSGTSIVAQPHYAPAGLVDFDGYGRKVAVQSNGCELPACTSYTDVAVAFGGSKLYIAKRTTSGWQASQAINPPLGANFISPGGLDVSHYQVLAKLNITSTSPAIGCPVGPAVRVYYRSGINFAALGDACQPPSDEHATFGTAVAAERGNTSFYVASPDQYAFGSGPVLPLASVATFAGYPVITYVDSVQELSLAPAGPGWETYNDAFGASLSAFSTHMAVGAPWGHVFTGAPGIGYVVIYVTCC